MKKILIYILMFNLFVFSVIAANVYIAKDFTEHPEQLVIMEERDAVRLNWDNKEHKLMVSKIYPDKGKIDITSFIEGSEVPFYTTITPKTSLQLDFDQDFESDLKVSIFNILKDEKVVALNLKMLEKEPSPEITTSANIEDSKNKPNQSFIQNKIFIFIGLILLGVVMWKRRLLLKNYRKLKRNNK